MSNESRKKLVLISELFLFIGSLIFIIANNLSMVTAIGILVIVILIPLFIMFPYYSLLLLIIVRNAYRSENFFIGFN